MSGKRYRVAQWGTGHTGVRALQRVIDHPGLDLVAVRVYAEDKAGRDAGDLCGMAATGVKATRAIEDVLAAKPDCVLYMPLVEGADVGDLRRLLEAGASVVTVIPQGQFDDAARAKLQAAGERGGAAFYCTGPSPGFSTEILPLAVTALQRRLDFLLIDEFADMATRNSPELIGQMFGMAPEKMDVSEVAEQLKHHMGASMRQTAESLSIPFDEVSSSGAVAAAREDAKIGVTTIKAGTVAAWRFEVTGLRKGAPIIHYRATWYVTRDLDADWDVRDTGWHVVVKGDAPLDIDIKFTTENYREISPSYNANICVNAVASVCEAKPGVVKTADLPPIVARLG